ncbi:hypothetical protein A2738_02635 [Candidatus Nomurabacteria bacterium RIFCSPHIGHO2_01_FULL_42_15]|uniref:Uncharacterized protein n=1 Tax=Candidatus Nomurabacteria bacterium RIFCSPHIGHO2_01_FULL_42_15 TaxID=1801742 RepID=A0A1F6VEN2_9BACT|nr:MAG: hypothetical protein A2738_02635 [Candidatus Nomurabacteria bacterium RIFCSPHIGHO2_01_FULL_42_15]OGI92770.1 MAG: hypothetical protein A3A99_02700 [Candidatus Nomurabacteria bacterium RIFCSPLOWO2_01_FULL_41_18]
MKKKSLFDYSESDVDSLSGKEFVELLLYTEERYHSCRDSIARFCALEFFDDGPPDLEEERKKLEILRSFCHNRIEKELNRK